MSDAWKSFQRWACRFFGGECGWRGDVAECYEVSGAFAIEVKYRQRLPKWLTEGLEQAKDFALMIRKPYPVLIIGTAGQDRMKSLVVMELEKFDWLLRQADLKPIDRNKERTDDEHID